MKTKKQQQLEKQRETFLELMDTGTFWYCRPTIDETDDVFLLRPVQAKVLEIFERDSKRPSARIEYCDAFGDTGVYKNIWVVAFEDLDKYVFKNEEDAWIAYKDHLQDVYNSLLDRAKSVRDGIAGAEKRIIELVAQILSE